MGKEMKFVNADTYSDIEGNTYIYIGSLNGMAFFLDDQNITVRRYLNGKVALKISSSGDIVKHTKPIITRTRTVNIYADGEEVFPTNEDAIAARKPDILAVIDQSYTFVEGDGLD